MMRPKRGTLLLAAASLGAAVLLALPMTASAGAAQIAGVQAFDFGGVCTEAAGAFTMTGSLVGCWYTDTFSAKINPSGTVQGVGTEHFVGCLGATCGTLHMTFTFTGKFAGPPTFAEIHGRCHHPIVAGEGGFAGATGVVDFKDDVTTGLSYYRGHIKL
jgi:hypothetical protein